MQLPELIPAEFVRRDNRFRATVAINGTEVAAHVPNSGRLTDLFVAGQVVWVAPAKGEGRKTAFDLKLVDLEGQLVSVDARLPNSLFAEAVLAELFGEIRAVAIEEEVYYGRSRLDFCITTRTNKHWIETKSVTLVEEGIALFPDAPTARGRRHLEELKDIAQSGGRAMLVFVIQRSDAAAFAPHSQVDPGFLKALCHAHRAGVDIRAFTCAVSLTHITINREVAVRLPSASSA